MKTAYEEMKAELDRRQNPTLLESLQDYYDKKTQGRPPLPKMCIRDSKTTAEELVEGEKTADEEEKELDVYDIVLAGVVREED